MKRGLKFDILAQTDDVTYIELYEWPTQMFVRTYAAHGYLAKYGTILLPTAAAARKGQGSKPLNTWPGKHLKMPTCSVLGCKNKEGGSFSFHIFPKDRETRRKWQELCGRTDVESLNLRACSEHFSPSAFQRQEWSYLSQFICEKI